MSAQEPRNLWQAFRRGFFCSCPRCGSGKLFDGYLRTQRECSICAQAFEGHRADDAPPYIVISLVGHVVVGLLLYVEMHHTPPLWVHAVIWLPLTAFLVLSLLRPVKGAVIGWQWALRLHGFAEKNEQLP